MGKLEDLRIRQLDTVLTPLSDLRNRPVPRGGWVRNVRVALGMSLAQLAARTGLAKPSVASAERSEEAGSIQLDTLQRLADAMNCDLVYALVPRESLQQTVEDQARRIAQGLVGRVSESMELEAQGVPSEDRDRQIKQVAEDILRNRKRDFWDV